jgi:superfamily II DNA or RNA helicase
MSSRSKPSHALSMRDRMSHLSFAEASKLLGANGKKLLLQVGELELTDGDALRVNDKEAIAQWKNERNVVRSRISFDSSVHGKLRAECSQCTVHACVHIAALLSMLLQQKSDLGLAMPPPDAAPAGSETALLAQALDERAKRAKTEAMKITATDVRTPWTDYVVRSQASGKTYRVALRSTVRGESYCSCPDFKINTLGVCKHIMKVLARTSRFSAAERARPYVRKRVTVHLRYEQGIALAIALPKKVLPEVATILTPLTRGTIETQALMRCLEKLAAGHHAFHVTPDAEQFIAQSLLRARLAKLVAAVRLAPATHALRGTLLKEPLLPYQLDGIAFAVGAGRAILADEMGLGKTIQGVGTAELLARELGIKKVLVVCPASLKSQWRSEIERFSTRTSSIIGGAASERAGAYASEAFFTICNYEQVLKDITHIETVAWDLIILDEGQRIKNWEAKTSRVVKGLTSKFALVLSGTPLENRLDDLHSVVSFVDPHLLGPSFRFLHRHQRRDEAGKLTGFTKLDELRGRLRSVLLRRTRDSVKLELPPRSVEIVRIPATAEQLEVHDGNMRVVAQIVRKRYLTEMDLMRLRAALLMCRMAADSTFLVDKKSPSYSTKLERLAELFDGIAAEPDRKVVLFSEWTTMLDLIEPYLQQRKLGFVRLDGSVPQKKRQSIVAQFRSDPKARFFLTTNAGSTGLNLQAANTIINVDLPWNPAVLEQRIARAHRMGQTRPVAVYVLVTEGTLEESLLTTLTSKRDLAMAALDPDSQVADVDVRTQTDDIKARLEILLGAKPAAPIDESTVGVTTIAVANERLATAGGSMLKATLELFSAMTGAATHNAHPQLEANITSFAASLQPKLIVDEHGHQRLSLGMPTQASIGALMQGFSALFAATATPFQGK